MDEAGKRQGALGAKIKPLSLPYTPYSLKTTAGPILKSHSTSKARPSPRFQEVTPMIPSHHTTSPIPSKCQVQCWVLTLPCPSSQQHVRPGLSPPLRGEATHATKEVASQRGSLLPVLPDAFTVAVCGHVGSRKPPRQCTRSHARPWTRSSPLLSHFSFPSGQKEV